MRNEGYAIAGAFGGIFTGITTAGILTAGVTTASGGASLLAGLPFILGAIPFYHLAKRLNRTYEDKPLSLMSSYFLLTASAWTLCATMTFALSAAFVAINPFTLPILMAAGVSAFILLALYLCTRDNSPKPLRPQQSAPSRWSCSLFSNQPEPESYENDTADFDAYLASQRQA